jgi:hypothetical protein
LLQLLDAISPLQVGAMGVEDSHELRIQQEFYVKNKVNNMEFMSPEHIDYMQFYIGLAILVTLLKNKG